MLSQQSVKKAATATGSRSFQPTFIFVTENNKERYKSLVLTWLQSDFNLKKQPFGHFWHNRSIISGAFDQRRALVALNDQQEVIGFMIWSTFGVLRMEIDIVEVKEAYRRQGVFKKAQLELSKKFPEIVILTASVIPQAVSAFRNDGWTKIENNVNYGTNTTFIKEIKPCLQPFDKLPEGNSIAVCSTNFYEVKAKPEQYKTSMKYFQIAPLANGILPNPIATGFHYEGYVGIYKDKKLVAQGKAKHLFDSKYFDFNFNFLIIRGMRLLDQSLFPEYREEETYSTNYTDESGPEKQEENPGLDKRALEISQYYSEQKSLPENSPAQKTFVPSESTSIKRNLAVLDEKQESSEDKKLKKKKKQE